MESLGMSELVDLGRSLSSLLPRLSSRQQQLDAAFQDHADACAALVQRASVVWIQLKKSRDSLEEISDSTAAAVDDAFWKGFDVYSGASASLLLGAATEDLLALLLPPLQGLGLGLETLTPPMPMPIPPSPGVPASPLQSSEKVPPSPGSAHARVLLAREAMVVALAESLRASPALTAAAATSTATGGAPGDLLTPGAYRELLWGVVGALQPQPAVVEGTVDILDISLIEEEDRYRDTAPASRVVSSTSPPLTPRGALERLLSALLRCDLAAAYADVLDESDVIAESALPVELLVDLCSRLGTVLQSSSLPAGRTSLGPEEPQLRRVCIIAPDVSRRSRVFASTFTTVLVSVLGSVCRSAGAARGLVAGLLTPDLLRDFAAAEVLASVRRLCLCHDGAPSAEDSMCIALLCAVCLVDPISTDILLTKDIMNALCTWVVPTTNISEARVDSPLVGLSQQVLACCVIATTVVCTEYGSPVATHNLAALTRSAVLASNSQVQRAIGRFISHEVTDLDFELQSVLLLQGLLIPMFDPSRCLSHLKALLGDRTSQVAQPGPLPLWSGALNANGLFAPLQHSMCTVSTALGVASIHYPHMKVLLDIDEILTPAFVEAFSALESRIDTISGFGGLLTEYLSLVCGLCLDGSGQDSVGVESNRKSNFDKFYLLINSSKPFVRVMLASMFEGRSSLSNDHVSMPLLAPKYASMLPPLIELCAQLSECGDDSHDSSNILQNVALVLAQREESTLCSTCSQLVLDSLFVRLNMDKLLASVSRLFRAIYSNITALLSEKELIINHPLLDSMDAVLAMMVSIFRRCGDFSMLNILACALSDGAKRNTCEDLSSPAARRLTSMLGSALQRMTDLRRAMPSPQDQPYDFKSSLFANLPSAVHITDCASLRFYAPSQSDALSSSGNHSTARVSNKIKRFSLRNTPSSPGYSLSSRLFIGEKIDVQTSHWSPLLAQFSISVWFKPRAGQGESTWMGHDVLLTRFRNDYEEFSLYYKDGVISVGLSVLVHERGGSSNELGIDIDLNNFSDNARVLPNEWNHLCLVQRKTEDHSSESFSMSLTAYLNGAPSSENKVLLPPIETFTGLMVDPSDGSMDYEVSFGIRRNTDPNNLLDTAYYSASDCKYLEIASILIFEQPLPENLVVELCASGPNHKFNLFGADSDLISALRSFAETSTVAIDLAQCPRKYWKSFLLSKRSATEHKVDGDLDDIIRVGPQSFLSQIPDTRIILSVDSDWKYHFRGSSEYSNLGPEESGSRHNHIAASLVSSSGRFNSSDSFEAPCTSMSLEFSGPVAVTSASRFHAISSRDVPSATIETLISLATASQDKNTQLISLQVLGNILHLVPHVRQYFIRSKLILALSATVRDSVRSISGSHGAAVYVALMGLCGCVVPSPLQANNTGDSRVYCLSDPNFAAVVFGNTEVIPKIDDGLFCFLLRSMQFMFFDVSRGNEARLRQLHARSFSCNKIQLAKARVARNFIVAMTSEDSSDLSVHNVLALRDFLFMYFTSDDGLGRTSAAEDDFEFLAAAVSSTVSKFARAMDGDLFETTGKMIDNIAAYAIISLLTEICDFFALRAPQAASPPCDEAGQLSGQNKDSILWARRGSANPAEKAIKLPLPSNQFVSVADVFSPFADASKKHSNVAYNWTHTSDFQQDSKPDPSLHQAPTSLLDDFQSSDSPRGLERIDLASIGSGIDPRASSLSAPSPEALRSGFTIPNNFQPGGGDVADRFVAENTKKIVKYLSTSIPMSDALSYLNMLTSSLVTLKGFVREAHLDWVKFNSSVSLSILKTIISFHYEVVWCDYSDAQLDELAKEIQVYSIRLLQGNLFEFPTDKDVAVAENAGHVWSWRPENGWTHENILSEIRFASDDQLGFLPFQFDAYMPTNLDTFKYMVSSSGKCLPSLYRTGMLIQLLMEPLLGSREASARAITASLEGWNFSEAEPVYAFSTVSLSSCDAFCDALKSDTFCPFGSSPEQLIHMNASAKFNFNFLAPLLSLMTWASARTSTVAVIQMHPKLFSEIEQNAAMSLANRIVSHAQRTTQTILAVIYGLWSRFPQFQKALLSESSSNLQSLVESVLEVFVNSGKAQYLDILCSTTVGETGQPETAATEISGGLESILERLSAIRNQVGSDTLPQMSNIDLYKSCGSTIGRMCLQLATGIMDSYFLASGKPANRSYFGYPSESFWLLIEKAMIAFYKQPTNILPIPPAAVNCIVLLFNATTRRRVSLITCSRLSALLSARLASFSEGEEEGRKLAEVWNQSILSVERVSKLILCSISLEQELSKRTQGAELNFSSRVLAPISYLSELIDRMGRVQESMKVYEGPKQQTGDADKDSIAQGGGATVFGGTVFQSFGRRSAASTDVDASQPNKASVASSFGGLVGNFLKKGMQNISSVTVGPDRPKWTSFFNTSNRGDGDAGMQDFESQVLPKVLNNIRIAFVHIIDVQSRRSSETVARILASLQPLITETIVLDIAVTSEQNSRGQQLASILSGNIKDSEDAGILSFIDYLYIYLYSLLIKDNNALAEQGAVLWGMLLSHANPDIFAAARKLLVVEVKSPNDSSMSMRIDMWNYEGIGLSPLVRIATLASDEKGREAVPSMVASISRWLNKMPDSLREAFKSQLISSAKPFQRKTRIAIESNLRPFLTLFEEQASQKFLKLQTAIEAKLPNQASNLDQRSNSYCLLNSRIVNDWQHSNIFGALILNTRILGSDARHVYHLTRLRPYTGKTAETLANVDCSLLIPPHARIRLSNESWYSFQTALGFEVTNSRGVYVKYRENTDPNIESKQIEINKSFDGARAQVQPPVVVGIVQPRGSLIAPLLYSLSKLNCIGEWAVDPSEGYCRTRSRLKRCPLVILEVDNSRPKDSSKDIIRDISASSDGALSATRGLHEELMLELAAEKSSSIDLDSDGDEDIDRPSEFAEANKINSWHFSDLALNANALSLIDPSDVPTDEPDSRKPTPSNGNDESAELFASKSDVIESSDAVFVEIDQSYSAQQASQSSQPPMKPPASRIDVSESSSTREENGGNSLQHAYKGMLDVAGDAIRTTNLKTRSLGQKGASNIKSLFGLGNDAMQSENATPNFSQYVPPGETLLEHFPGHIVFGMEIESVAIVLTDRSVHILNDELLSSDAPVNVTANWMTPARAESSASADAERSIVQSARPESFVTIPSRSKLSSALLSVMINADAHMNPGSSYSNCVVANVSYGDVVGVHRRRFLLTHKAVEIFLLSGKSILLALPSVEEKNKFCSHLMRRCSHIPGLDLCLATEHDDDLFATTPLGMTPMSAGWFARQRRGNEGLSPTEPLHLESLYQARERWDYTSSSLHLDDPTVYRDLRRPMGALNPLREREARKKFDDLMQQFKESRTLDSELADDQVPSIPPFHYGTHYSSAAGLLYYMVRLQPFAAHAVALQGGKRFDKPDRLFQSIEKTWSIASGGVSSDASTATSNLQDVKELIPEFFYLPEFLVNINGYNLGTTSEGIKLADVELPPWAHGCPKEFIRIHRLALESEHVTRNLHHWIDLIFGFKQRGPKAVESCNIFQHLSYEGSVDVDAITSDAEREAIRQQIRDFGQTPSQLFRNPHPPSRKYNYVKKSLVQNEQGELAKSDIAPPAEDAYCKTSFQNPLRSEEGDSSTDDIELLSVEREVPTTLLSTSFDEMSSISKVPGASDEACGYCSTGLVVRVDRFYDEFTALNNTLNLVRWRHSHSRVLNKVVAFSLFEPPPGQFLKNPWTFPDTAPNPSDVVCANCMASRISESSPLNRPVVLFAVPAHAIFVPWYEMAEPRSSIGGAGAVEGRGASISKALLLCWGIPKCTFKLYLNESFLSDITTPLRREYPARGSGWEHIRTISLADIQVSCAAASNSGRLILSGSATSSAVHKWRVYPIPGGTSVDASTGAKTIRRSDCTIALVDTYHCPLHEGPIKSVALSVMNGMFVSQCESGSVLIGELATMHQVRIVRPSSVVARSPLYSDLYIHPKTGSILVSSSERLRLFDNMGREMCSIGSDLMGSSTAAASFSSAAILSLEVMQYDFATKKLASLSHASSSLAAVVHLVAAGCSDGRVGVFFVGPSKLDKSVFVAELFKKNQITPPQLLDYSDDNDFVSDGPMGSAAVTSVSFPKVSASCPAHEAPLRLYVGAADGHAHVWTFLL